MQHSSLVLTKRLASRLCLSWALSWASSWRALLSIHVTSRRICVYRRCWKALLSVTRGCIVREKIVMGRSNNHKIQQFCCSWSRMMWSPGEEVPIRQPMLVQAPKRQVPLSHLPVESCGNYGIFETRRKLYLTLWSPQLLLSLFLLHTKQPHKLPFLLLLQHTFNPFTTSRPNQT